jgi:hypothetical protein
MPPLCEKEGPKKHSKKFLGVFGEVGSYTYSLRMGGKIMPICRYKIPFTLME